VLIYRSLKILDQVR